MGGAAEQPLPKPLQLLFADVGGILLSGLPQNTILLFGAEGKWNLNGTEELIIDIKNIPYLLADGRTRYSSRIDGKDEIHMNWNKHTNE